MSTHKRIDLICVIVLVCTLLITVLFMNGELLGLQKIVDEDAERHSDSVYFTANDLDGDWDASSPTATIILTGDGARISGKGAYWSGGTVTITGGGKYVLSGTLTDGCVVVDAYKSSKVWLLLDGAEITNSQGPALWVQQADKVFVTLAAGTENALTDGESYSQEALKDGADGALFSHDDVTINGSGSLTVTGNYKHGIAANDDLVITGGALTVTSAADGVRANDSLRVCSADITVDARDDGIVAANEEEGQGWLYIESGSFTLTTQDDAIHTAGDITIDGGTFTITAGDDGIHSDTAITLNDGTILIRDCYEGIEAVTIDMTGGDVTVYPQDDGFNANGGSDSFGMMGGGMGGFGGRGGDPFSSGEDGDTAESGDLPQRPDQDDGGDRPTPPDGEGSLPEMPEGGPGFDGSMPEFDGSMPELDGQRRGESGDAATEDAADSQETYIRISGGSVTIINETGRDADGLDSNGSVYITGGDIRISLTNSGSNSAIDYGSENNGVCEIIGGTVIACGSYSMAESFDTTSTQCSVLYNFSTGAEAGSTLALEDAQGNILLSWEVPCSFSSANLSCPEMEVGGAYQVVINDQAEEITLEETSASFGDAASTMFGGMNRQGGGMQMRGGQGRGSDAGSPEDSAEPSGAETPVQGGPGGGGFGGGRGGRMEIFSLLEGMDGVTLDQDRNVTVTAQGAQALLAALAEAGIETDATAEELQACATLEELMTALGMSFGGPGGRGGGPGGDFGGQGGESAMQEGGNPPGFDSASEEEDNRPTPPEDEDFSRDETGEGRGAPGEASPSEGGDASGAESAAPGGEESVSQGGEAGDRPTAPEGGQDFSPQEERENSASLDEAEEAVTDTRTAIWDLPQETWIWLGLSAAVLLAGLFIALVFKRR